MIPEKLILENFTSHIHSVIDFSQFNSALITGSAEGNVNISNGVGKTSLMSGIRFASYGKTQFSSKSKVVMRGKESCRVEYIFSAESDKYKIIRKLNARTGIMSVDFFRKEGDKWNSKGWTCDTPTQTNAKIIEIIGMNDETFVNVVYFRQNDVSGFTGANTSKRKEILKEALQIGIWDEFQEVSKNSGKELLKQLETIEERIKIIGDVEEEISKINNKIIKNEKSIIKFKNEIPNIEKNIIDYTNKIGTGDFKILEKELSIISKRAKNITERKNILKENNKKNNEVILLNENECLGLNNKLINYYETALKINHRERGEIEKSYILLNKEPITISYSAEQLNKNKDKRKSHQKVADIIEFDLKQLNLLEPGKECPTCLAEIENPENIIKKREEKRKLLKEKLNKEKKIIKELNENIKIEEKAIQEGEIAIFEIEKIKLNILKKETLKTEAEKDNLRIREEIKLLGGEWQQIKERKQHINELLKNSDNSINDFVEKRSKLEKQLTSLKEELFKLEYENNSLKLNREILDKHFSEKQTLINEKSLLSSNIAVYSKLTTAFGKDGIQSIIMENITEDLKEYTNSILKNIYHKPIYIDFITQRQTTTGTWKEEFDIVIYIDNEKYDFEDVSGGEQVRISIALRLALSQLLMRRVGSNIRFLLFDEVDQSLDKHGLDALLEVIKELEKEFKILVITHNDYLKDKFEKVITVHMGPEGSILR